MINKNHLLVVKRHLRRNKIVRYGLNIRKKINDKRADKLRAPFIPDVIKLVGKDTTIISSNCFAGRIMQDVGMEYNSPTLGLYFWAEDYIEFLTHLKYYLTEAKIEFVEHSKHALGDTRRQNWEHWYPIGVLNGKVEIHFLHYHTEEEAAEKWYRRAGRHPCRLPDFSRRWGFRAGLAPGLPWRGTVPEKAGATAGAVRFFLRYPCLFL